jgi:prevent-host-death family protein
MERVVSATEARNRFGALMRYVVESRAAVIVERGGEPKMVLLSVSEYERLRAPSRETPDWRRLVDEAHAQIQIELGHRELPSSEEMLRLVREERDDQLFHLR